MVKRVIWAPMAIEERRDILNYWAQRNKSKVFSKKLYALFLDAVNRIAINPNIGHLTNRTDTRIKVVRDYLIVYKLEGNDVKILSILDGRRNPEELNKRL